MYSILLYKDLSCKNKSGNNGIKKNKNLSNIFNILKIKNFLSKITNYSLFCEQFLIMKNSFLVNYIYKNYF